MRSTLEFESFVAIDWSGAVGSRQSGIAVAICAHGYAAPEMVRGGHVWSRSEVQHWLLQSCPPRALIGVDLGISLPFDDSGAFLPGWAKSPPDARSLWSLVDRVCSNEANLGANQFVDHLEASRHFRRHGGRQGDLFVPGRGRLRVTEHRQREQGLSPTSNFNLVGAAQVGKSSLTGMRMLHQLSGRLPVWPIEDPVPGQSLIIEIYTSLAARAAGVPKGRTKVRDGATLDMALANLDSQPHAPLPRYTDHATDAILTSAWLRKVAHDPALWHPPGLDAVRHTEGWTFGVR